MAKRRAERCVYAVRIVERDVNQPVLQILAGVPPLTVGDHWIASVIADNGLTTKLWGRSARFARGEECARADLHDKLREALE